MALMINGLFPGELTPDSTVGGCIDIFENVWPNPAETIKAVEKECTNPDSGAFWQRAETIGDGPFQRARTNKLLNVTYTGDVGNNPVMQNVHNQYRMLLMAATVPYTFRYNIQEELVHEQYQLLKYGAGEEYRKHYDGSTRIGRAVSAIVYLNSDYVGGEIEFPNFGVKIKPEPGMLILFPSNYAYAHVAHPVTSGTKYALVTWLKDRPN
jgi:hypothetical protein